MSAPKNLKFQILELRQKNMSYRQIQSILNCTRSTVHYHCKNNNLTDMGKKRYPIDDNLKLTISNFCKENKVKKAIKTFNISQSTAYKYKNFQLRKNEQ